MIRSMTGFGSARVEASGWQLSIECRSVNHRGLDIRVHTPREWAWLEPIVLEIGRSTFHRGRIDARVTVERSASSGGAALVDPERFRAVSSELKQLVETNALDGGVQLRDVLSFREVLAGEAPAEDVSDDPAIPTMVREAFSALDMTRLQEGARLLETLETLIAQIQHDVEAIAVAAEEAIGEYRQRLADRVTEALEKFDVGEIDQGRVIHEVTFYADRTDIAEEVQRATSHLEKLREIVSRDADEPSGKTIDFYLQELMREANTMGSKTGTPVVTDAVIRIKTAVEQMREQAANIE